MLSVNLLQFTGYETDALYDYKHLSLKIKLQSLQRQILENQKKKKRMQPGIIKANEERPRSSRSRRQEDEKRLVAGRQQKPPGYHQHGKIYMKPTLDSYICMPV